MIPGATVLPELDDISEFAGSSAARSQFASRWDRTSSYAVHAVHFHAVQLPDAMPMTARAIGHHIVNDSDVQRITPTSLISQLKYFYDHPDEDHIKHTDRNLSERVDYVLLA